MKNLTVLIKTFLRPYCLYPLLESISQYYQLPIVVVDDSEGDTFSIKQQQNITYIKTPFDVGTSEGRNIGVRYINTDYFVLCDDDFRFYEETKLEYFLETIEKGFDLVGGMLVENGEYLHYEGLLEKHDERLIGNPIEKGFKNGVPIYDIVYNFFIAKTEVVKQCPWDSDMKQGEHPSFFWMHKDKFLVGYDPRVKIKHMPCATPEYRQYRYRSRHYIENVFFKKHGFKGIIDFKGQKIGE